MHRMQREHEVILAQRQETQNKMAAFINTVSTSKPEASDTPNLKAAKAPIEAANHQESRDKVRFTLSNSHVHIVRGRKKNRNWSLKGTN